MARALESGGLVISPQSQKLSLGTLNAGKLSPFNLCFGWTQTLLKLNADTDLNQELATNDDSAPNPA